MDASPQQWRLLGNDSQPEAYIPLAPGQRARAIMDTLLYLKGSTDEDKARRAAAQQVIDANNAAELDAAVTRHSALLDLHGGRRIVAALLAQHGPHRESPTCAECQGCLQHYDDWGGYYDEWPCVVWRTIDEHTPDKAV